MRHVGIFPGPSWTLSLLEREKVFPNAAPPVPPEQFKLTIGTRVGPTPERLLASAGLAARVMQLPPGLFLFRVGQQPRILPGTGEAQHDSLVSTSWANLLRSCRDPRILRFAATQCLRAAVARMEELFGRRCVPCDSVTLCADGSGTTDFHDALNAAARSVFGCEPTFLWLPTAVTGWSLVSTTVCGQLLSGEGVELAQASAGRIVRVRANQADGRIETHIADSTADASAAPGDPAALVECEPAALAASAACGSALWGWWRSSVGASQVDRSPMSFVLAGNSLPAPLAGAAGADGEVPMIDVTPLRSDQSAGDRAAPQWFARAIALRERPAGTISVRVCAKFPWTGSALLLADVRSLPDDASDHWRGRYSFALWLSSGRNDGKVLLVKPQSKEIVNNYQFKVLPEPGDGATRDSEPAPEFESLRRAFRMLPQPQSYEWEVDARTEALVHLETSGRSIPGELGASMPVHVLCFSREAEALQAEAGPAGAFRMTLVTSHQLQGVRRYEFRIDRDPGHEGESQCTWRVHRSGAPGGDTVPAPAPMHPPLTGAVLLLPPNYGLAAELQWNPEQGDLLHPFPVARALSLTANNAAGPSAAPSSAVPQAVGVVVAPGGHRAMISRPIEGRLVLKNGGVLPLRIELVPDEGLRVALRWVALEPRQRMEIPVERRTSLVARDLQRFRSWQMTLRAQPQAPPGERVAPLSVLTLVDAPSSRAASRGQPTLCVPDVREAELRLQSWMPPGSWSIELTVVGSAEAEVALGPQGQSREQVRALIPGAEEEASRTALLRVLAQPPILLRWFPGPMRNIIGVLEVRHDAGVQDAGPQASGVGVQITCPFRASIEGVISIARSIEIDSQAGESLVLPLELLTTDDLLLSGTLLDWHWTGDGPYPMKCRMLEASEAPASGFRTLAPRVVSQLDDTTLTANQGLRRQHWVEIQPVQPTGWEDGTWAGSLVISGANGTALDEIQVSCTLRAQIPRLGIRIARDKNPAGELMFEFGVANANPYQKMSISAVDLSAQIRLASLTVDRARFTFEKGPPSGEQLAAGESRVWRGRVVTAKRMVSRAIFGFARRATVEMRLIAVCEARRGSAAEYVAQIEIEIG